MPPLTPQQEARLEAEVFPLEQAASQQEQNGEREESFRLKREALARMEAIVGTVNESLADSFILFAYDLRDEGDYEEAEPLVLRALSIYETLYGPNSLEAATQLFNLGDLHDNWERWEMSLPLYRRALAIEETLCGKRSREVAATCTWLGDAYLELRHYTRAEAYFRRAAEIHQAPQTWQGKWPLALTQERLAGTLFRRKRYGGALKAYEEVLALRQGKFRWKQSRRRYNLCRIRSTSANN